MRNTCIQTCLRIKIIVIAKILNSKQREIRDEITWSIFERSIFSRPFILRRKIANYEICT